LLVWDILNKLHFDARTYSSDLTQDMGDEIVYDFQRRRSSHLDMLAEHVSLWSESAVEMLRDASGQSTSAVKLHPQSTSAIELRLLMPVSTNETHACESTPEIYVYKRCTPVGEAYL
jgi:hypothetical protein